MQVPSQSQDKVQTDGADLHEEQVDVTLSATLARGRIAGPSYRHFNSKPGMCLR
jgi:hypothetical protein